MNRFKLRTIIQIFTLLGWLILLFLLIRGILYPAHQYCPYAVVCFGSLYPLGYHLYLIAVIAGLAIALSAIFIGRRFCGYICFFGTIQEVLFLLRSKLYPKKIGRNFSDNLLKKIKYIILLATIILTLTYLSHLYMHFCPVLALAEIKYIGLPGLISLMTILLFGFIIERFWCRYLCPYAALMNIVQVLGSFIGIKRTVLKQKKCINCGICSNVCPMNIDLEKVGKITDPNCIHCLRCVKHCPDTGKIDY